MTRNLKSVAQFADATPFTAAQIRWWIFRGDENGLAKSGAIVRIGTRRIYLDVDRFDEWLTAQNPPQAAASGAK